MSFMNCLLVGIGGFLGAVLRYLIGLLPVGTGSFPVKTWCINLAGAFAIGLIAAFATKNPEFDPHLVLLLKVGVCGGFTTFSTFAFETTDLLEKGSVGMALTYAVSSVVLGVLAVYAAQRLVG